ncbi:hypothetical protein BRD00_15115 [Halobacteriales archaeon QS_8_69_26]|nr:MAG: hypothetical protein BRD00_15115 [Halobacteriales archaeon QS_8_69_26]
MRVRDWKDIVEDVAESGADPDDWRAIAGDRESGVGEDMYLTHPSVGVYQLKTYAKNPFEVRGVGTKVARRVDDGIEPVLPDRESGRFAVQSPPEDEDEAEDIAGDVEAVLEAHADVPTEPTDLFDDVMDAMDSPAFGPIDYEFDERPEGLDELATTYEEAQEVLEAEFEELVEGDSVGRGFH